jgi:hypothetical protein
LPKQISGMRHLIYLPFILLGIYSCNGESKLSDQDLMEKNVRNYFFMGDSVEVEVTITDTLKINDVEDILANIQNNIGLIQLDIDTLQLMIDDWTYKAMDFEKTGKLTEASDAKIKSLEYRVKLKELQYKQAEFSQTNRIFLHLKRSTWADISGFEAAVHSEMGDEVSDLVVLMDANFNVVD